MTKEQALSATSSLLQHVFESDIDATATIINAEAGARMGNAKGVNTLVKALASVREFIDELTVKIQETEE